MGVAAGYVVAQVLVTWSPITCLDLCPGRAAAFAAHVTGFGLDGKHGQAAVRGEGCGNAACPATGV